ncbi:MAG: ATP-binding protein [Candidatus Omnitrophota bacterium]
MREKNIRILLVEDNPGDVRLIRDLLEQEVPASFEITHVELLQEVLKIIDKEEFGLVLLDLNLPDSRGLDTFQRVYAEVPEVPIVIMSIVDDEDLAMEAVKKGAQDYLIKGKFDSYLLNRAIRYAIERKILDNLKNEFLRIASHELRTPLAIIKESINLILDEIPGEVNSRQEQVLIVARENIDRLSRFVNDLLDISKIEARKVELNRDFIDISSLMKDTASYFEKKAKDKKLKLITSLPQEPVSVYADKDKISHIFTNLVSNAVKFTEKGRIKLSVQDKDKEIECAVEDTGIGISREDKEKIFTKFKQGKLIQPSREKGTGLGLSIVKGLVEMHNGRVWVESELGKGSKFIFTIPKYSIEAVIKESLSHRIEEARNHGLEVSLIAVSMQGFVDLSAKLKNKKLGIEPVLNEIGNIVKGKLRREKDIVLRDRGNFFLILNNCGKQGALAVIERVEQGLTDYRNKNKLFADIKFSFNSAVFPVDAESERELLNRIKEV